MPVPLSFNHDWTFVCHQQAPFVIFEYVHKPGHVSSVYHGIVNPQLRNRVDAHRTSPSQYIGTELVKPSFRPLSDALIAVWSPFLWWDLSQNGFARAKSPSPVLKSLQCLTLISSGGVGRIIEKSASHHYLRL